jgi:hypothetical protein
VRQLHFGNSVAALCLLAVISAAAIASNPVPTVVGPPNPQAVVPGSGTFTLQVYGANFVSGATVNWNRQPRETKFISARELHAQILASDVATPTAGYITVTNPPPGGGVSSSSYGLVEVHEPTSTIVVNQPNRYLQGIGAELLVLSDFNNDGILDFATDISSSEIKALLGNGDGTFRYGSIAAHSYYGSGPAAIAAGDFNNDGNEDLAFGADVNGPPTQLGVNFGDGEGKFRYGTRSSFHFGNYPFAMALGDFNRDGNLDLVSATTPTDLLVFLGEGNGILNRTADYSAFGSTPFALSVADLNGDGILDLVALADGIYTLIGKGDGTFENPKHVIANEYPGCDFGPALFMSDFNNDGKADIAFCAKNRDVTGGKIWVALGNGDGTFQKPTSITVPAYDGVFSFAVGDFNSDGKTDLLANYFTSGKFNRTETDLFLGNGDGTFQPKRIISLPGEPFYNAENGIATGDFNSDGLLDFIVKEPGDFDVFVQK